jgi:hypothetical protein
VGLLAFIFLYERGTVSSKELNERKGRVFPNFVRNSVRQLEIERKGATVVLSRGKKPDEIELGMWVVDKPFSAKADQDKVDAALGAVEWVNAKRTLTRIGDDDRKRFGFDKPTLRVWYTLDNKRIAFIIGQRDPMGQGYYLQTDDPSVAFVVGKDLIDALDREPGDFRTKALHAGITPNATGSITLRDEDGERVVQKRGEDWWLTKPNEALASGSAVEELIKGLDELKAAQFVADPAGDLARYGLETPVFEVVVREAVKNEGKPTVSLDLRVGTHCGDKQGESYVAAGRPGAVVCVADEALSKVRKSTGGLRDKRLLTLEDDSIKSVLIEEAERRLELKKTESKWSYKATVDGNVTASGQADAGAVAEWFKALRAVKADSFLPADAATLRTKQLDSPRIALTFERTGESKKHVIKVGARENYQVFVKRGQEPAVALFTGKANALMLAQYFRFRALQLVDESESELSQIQVQLGSTTEIVKKQGEAWFVEQPTRVEADLSVMADLVKLFSHLRAVRFVADAVDSSHGFNKPSAILTARYDSVNKAKASKADKPGSAQGPVKTRTFTLKLGSPVEGGGGNYAQLNQDPAVFIASQELVDRIVQRFANRSIMATPLEQLQRIKMVKRGENPVEIQRQGEDEWVAIGKGVNRERAKRIAETIASLRAYSVSGYGNPSFWEGMNYARVRIFIERKADAPAPSSYEIAIGNDAPRDASGARVYARRTGTAVGFTLPAKVVKVFLE